MSLSEKYRTKCPFCSVQDDVIIERMQSKNAVFGAGNLYNLYYDDKNDRGLCPRGNFVRELINSPYRLKEPRYEGKVYPYKKVFSECASRLDELSSESNSVAILLSGNHTLEEGYIAKKFAETLNTEHMGLFPFEDEALLSMKNEFSFDDLRESDIVLSIGDIFSNSPTLAKVILDARNLERENRLLSLDIIEGRITPFAESYTVNPGWMSYFLSLLDDYLDGKKVDLEKTGVGLDNSALESIAETLKSSENGHILFSNQFGHFNSPLLISEYLSSVAQKTENNFAVIPVGQNSLGIGRIIGGFNNGKIIKKLKEGEIKGLITLGGNPYEFIPGFERLSEDIDLIISTSFFSGEKCDGYLIPSAFSFEKEGSIISLEEEVVSMGESLEPVGDIISDGKFITELIETITGDDVKAKVSPAEPLILEDNGEPHSPSTAVDEDYPYNLIGVGLPYHHANGEITRQMKWNKDRGGPCVFLNINNIKELDLKDRVTVETIHSSAEFIIEDIEELPFKVPENTVAVSIHNPESRRLFPVEPDSSGIYSPGALKARLKK